MSLDTPISVGDGYAIFLADLWKGVSEFREKQIANFVSGKRRDNDTNGYITRLVSIYIELEPKVNGRTELGKYKKQFDDLKPYTIDPKMLLPMYSQSIEGADIIKKVNWDKLRELDGVLRNVLEELGVTKFER